MEQNNYHNLLENVFDLSPISTLIFDKDGHYISSNKAYFNIFKMIPEKNFSIFDNPTMEQLGLTKIMQRFKDGQNVEIENFFFNPYLFNQKYPDNPIRLNIQGQVVFNEKKEIEQYVVFHQEITKQKERDETLQKTKELAEEHEQKFSIIFEKSANPILILGNDKFVDCNTAALNILGYSSKEEILNLTPSNISPEFQENGKSSISESIRLINLTLKNGFNNFEWLHKKKNGDVFPVEVTLTAIENNNKKLLHVNWTDLSERKNVEYKLKESEARYRFLGEQQGQMIYDFLLDSDTISWYGDVEGVTGYSEKEFNDFNLSLWEESIHIDDKEHTMFLLNDAIKHSKKYFANYRFKLKNGTYKYIEDTGNFLFDENGKANQMIGVMKDITERKIADQKLKESQEKYKELSDLIPQMVFESDLQGKLTYLNKAGYKLTGATPETLKEGLTIISHIVDEDKPRMLENIQKSLQGLGNESDEYTGIDANDKIINILASASPIFKDNTIVGIRGIVVDITEIKNSQKEVRDSEIRHRELADLIPQMVFETDLGGNVTYLNKSGFQMAGVSQDTLKTGLNLSSLIDEKDIPRMFQNFHDMMTGIGHTSDEYIGIDSNNNKVNVMVSASPIINDETIIGMRGLVVDITDIRNAENKLIESEKKHRELADLIPQMVYEADLRGNLTYMNKKGFELTGRTPEELEKGINLMGFLLPEEIPRMMKNYQLLIQGKVEEHLGNEYLAEDADKNIRNISIYSSPVIYKDKVTGIRGIVIDITDIKQAENIIKESEQKYRELADLLPQIVYEMDTQGNFTYLNKKGYEFAGIQKDDLKKGFNFLSIMPSEKIETAIEDMKFILQGNYNPGSEYPIYDKDKKLRTAIMSASPIKKDDTVVGIRGLVIDITDMKKIEAELRENNIELEIAREKAEESDRLKSAFLANMSHEIRTPMNGIIGFTQVLLNIEKNDKHLKYLDIIHNSGKHLLNLINDIVDLSKIDANQLDINEETISINSVLSELQQFYKSFIVGNGKENIEVVFEYGLNNNNDFILSDETRIRQILNNLIGNAAKFTEEGMIKVKYIVEGNNMLKFSVQDTGIGIPKNDIALIFDRFIQSSKTNNKMYSGTGLGLAISKACVNLLGGKIWVESAIDKGTTFYFTIPFKPAIIDPALLNNNTILGDSTHDFADKTILIVEDDEVSTLFLTEVLSETDVNLIYTDNGKDAIDICTKNDAIDLVLMDIQLPILDGKTAIIEIKKIKPNLTIIAQTANAMDNDKIQIMKIGADDYIEKPINIDILMKMLFAFLR